ncbi:MAG: multicomponent Na+:H+ antiporter subunit [Thermosipho sp. (in: thermotogales)]|nr:multicomponent Na+:H+ antiporter subunit [Thermosipho sp. (in: thermotogales)]MDN5324862.1 multicomponent Na+:H+ antiporter subunit [Thermosipho sp. (in: thermotogales)]
MIKYFSLFLLFFVLIFVVFQESNYTINFSKLGTVDNFVTEIYLKNRVYDTIFEVLIFSLAALGVLIFNFSFELKNIILHENHIRILLRFLSYFVMLSSFYLAFFGHISPGGGFSAGVAGGTALLLYALSTTVNEFEYLFRRLKIKLFEKLLLLFIYIFSITVLLGYFKIGYINNIVSLNILIYFKVMFGTWIILYSFIKHRGII